MAEVRVTYWGEIPCSVQVKEGRGNRASAELPKIYMVTVDSVATKSGATSAEDYAAGFRIEKSERESTGDLKALAQQIVDELVAQYPREWLWAQRDKAGLDAAGQAQAEAEAGGE